jgi:hypothetical protein
VMVRIEKPTGLICYATENVIKGDEYRLVSPRLIGYAIAVCVSAGLLALHACGYYINKYANLME